MLLSCLLTFAESCEESELGDLSDFKHCKSNFCQKEIIKILMLIVVTALEWQILWDESRVGGRAPMDTVGSGLTLVHVCDTASCPVPLGKRRAELGEMPPGYRLWHLAGRCCWSREGAQALPTLLPCWPCTRSWQLLCAMVLR